MYLAFCRASLRCFNGAATFQSRKLDASNRLIYDGYQWLQWGRDLSVAETIASTPQSPDPPVLQWGRDLSVAETGTRHRLIWRAKNVLQWGRDLSVAETRV